MNKGIIRGNMIESKSGCHKCEECYVDKSKKHPGITHYCRLTGNDVGQSHFGLNSPRSCPKRT